MIYTIEFFTPSNTHRPFVFEAGNDRVAIEWLHLKGCGLYARLWRGQNLLCAIPGCVGVGYLTYLRNGARPYGKGWRCPPDWKEMPNRQNFAL